MVVCNTAGMMSAAMLIAFVLPACRQPAAAQPCCNVNAGGCGWHPLDGWTCFIAMGAWRPRGAKMQLLMACRSMPPLPMATSIWGHNSGWWGSQHLIAAAWRYTCTWVAHAPGWHSPGPSWRWQDRDHQGCHEELCRRLLGGAMRDTKRQFAPCVSGGMHRAAAADGELRQLCTALRFAAGAEPALIRLCCRTCAGHC